MRMKNYVRENAWMVGGICLLVAPIAYDIYNVRRDMKDAKEVVSVSVFQNEGSAARPRFGSSSVFYGFDTDGDGDTDVIKERWTWYGSRAAAPMCSVFHKGERSFEEARQWMDKYRETK